MLLEMTGISVNYGKINAIRDISIAVPEGKIVTIIGGNGAGKTTTLRAMSGMVPITKGEITFEGKRIDGLPASKVVAHGIAHVPEGRRIFPQMTVEENLRTGAFLRRDKDGVENDLEDVFKRFERLRERRTQRAPGREDEVVYRNQSAVERVVAPGVQHQQLLRKVKSGSILKG